MNHVLAFYRNYHSSRYVKDDLVIRMRRPLSEKQISELNAEFKVLIKEGQISQRGPYDNETDARELPRLVFTHTKHKMGVVRKLIDRINEMGG